MRIRTKNITTKNDFLYLLILVFVFGRKQVRSCLLYTSMDVTNEDVYCDKTRLNQVLLNLLSNAVKFTPAGGTVSVRLKQLPGTAKGSALYEMCIRDSNYGMYLICLD